MDRVTTLIIIDLLATLTLAALAFFVLLIILIAFQSTNKRVKLVIAFVNFFSENSLSFAFLIATVATSGSLFLSEVAGFTPCKLCWYQRIFMYPQLIILGIATFKNDFSVKKYIIPLSVIGLGIAIYHYILQIAPILPLPCTDEIANCALKQVAPYGFVTIPFMSAVAFALILLFVFTSKNKKT